MPGKIEITQVALAYVEATQNDKINVTAHINNSTGKTQSLYMSVAMGTLGADDILDYEAAYTSTDPSNVAIGDTTFELRGIPLSKLSPGIKDIVTILSSTKDFQSGIVVGLTTQSVLKIISGGSIGITYIDIEKR